MKEDRRVKALRKLNLLDTGDEPIYDEITKLASLICGTPISLISLLDETRQYFKSNYGLEDVRETAKEISFCKNVITLKEPFFEVQNAKNFPEFASNPLVLGYPFLKYYLGVPIKDKVGNALGALCVIDTKERELNAHQKECLILLAKQIERLFELREQSINMNTLNDRLILLSDRLSHFSSIAAHDLKEPLRMIKSFTNLLQKKNFNHWDEKDLSYMHFITDGTRRLEVYIEGLLNYTKNLGANDSYESFNFSELIDEIVPFINEYYSNKKIIFEAKIELTSNMKLPRAAVHSICKNILDNAFKFSSLTESPCVALTVFEDDDNYFFSLIDNGLGIPKEKIAAITTPFVRLNSRKEFEGVGLGLSIVESQVQFLNGQLHIESEINNGTKVDIKIPKLN